MRESMSQNQALLLQRKFTAIDEQASALIAGATADLAVGTLHAQPGIDSGFRVMLHGGLGAGKTTWVRHFLYACGVRGRVKSPSFAVAESYQASGLALHHLDFYRQSDSTAWQGGGLRDLIAERGICLIEWPEKAHGLPAPHIQIDIDWPSEAAADQPRNLKIGFFHYPNDYDMAPFLDQWQKAVLA